MSNFTVNGIDYVITDTFGEGLYESCKEVKFGTMNTRAIEFIGAGAKNFRGNTRAWKQEITSELYLFSVL